jgi:hypothetical protein
LDFMFFAFLPGRIWSGCIWCGWPEPARLHFTGF